MKKLNNKVYENLGVKERIIASVEAKARGDDNEVTRLIKTCPKMRYNCTDPEYADRMNNLFIIQMALECDLMRHALSYLLAVFTGATTEIMAKVEAHALQTFADCHAAWQEFLDDNGLKLESMNKIIEDMRHPIVVSMLENPLQEPNREGIDYCKEIYNQIFNQNL